LKADFVVLSDVEEVMFSKGQEAQLWLKLK
jgi:hypothetical protein